MEPKPAYDIEALRHRIPILRQFVPMNNCSQSPQMDLTAAAAETYLESWRNNSSARGSVIRLAPHFYSTLDDVEMALNALEMVCRDLAD